MRLTGSIAIAACVLLVAGCSTSLKVQKVDEKHPADSPGSILYALPKKTLLISATYVLTKCKTDIDKDNKPTLTLEVEVTANVVGTNVLDSAERYLIPYEDIRSWMKDTSVTVEAYPNQTLKSLNGTITDQVGTVLTATAGTAIKFVAAAALTTTTVQKDQEMCTERVRKAVQDLDGFKAALDATNPKPSDAEAARLTKRIAAVLAESLTTKVALAWTPALCDFPSGSNASSKILRAAVPFQNWLTEPGLSYVQERGVDAEDLHIELAVPASARAADRTPLSGVIKGIVVADPAIGTIRVCKGPCPNVGVDGAVVDKVLHVASAAFPQLGRRIVLSLTNYFLQSSKLELAVSEDGVITKLGVSSTSTAAPAISALGANFDSAKAAIEANDKAKAAAQTAAQTKARDENKILAECLEAQDKIIAKGGVPLGKCQ